MDVDDQGTFRETIIRYSSCDPYNLPPLSQSTRPCLAIPISTEVKDVAHLTEFQYFPRLPSEIQEMIWEQAAAVLPELGPHRYRLTISILETRIAYERHSAYFDRRNPGITACLNAPNGYAAVSRPLRALVGTCQLARQIAIEAVLPRKGDYLWISHYTKDARGKVKLSRGARSWNHGGLCLEVEQGVFTPGEFRAAKAITAPYCTEPGGYSRIDMITNMNGLNFGLAIRHLTLVFRWRPASGEESPWDPAECPEVQALVSKFPQLIYRDMHKGPC